VRIGVKYSSPAVKVQVMDQARVLMRTLRGQKYDEKDHFGIIASESLTKLWDDIFGGIAGLAVGIVSVFLLVGGIVVMNIMLASVVERTREIGLRKSLGARQRDILMQFLVEASVLTTTGGVIGVLIAFAITLIVSSTTDVPMRTPLGAVVLAVGVSTAVGLFFGIYPARKAARYDPVVALRAE
jgi:putative ABC transport system permease protein